MFQLLYALFHFKLLLFSPRIQPRAALLIFRRINPLSISAVYASINQKTDPFYTYSHLSYWIQPRVHQCNATCFSLFLDVGMAYILGALESPNSGAQKCIGKWLRENDSFKKYRTFWILFAIIGSFCFVLPHSCLQSICRTQCQLSDAFKKVKFGLCTKEIWTNLNIYVLPIFEPQKFRQIYISYNH